MEKKVLEITVTRYGWRITTNDGDSVQFAVPPLAKIEDIKTSLVPLLNLLSSKVAASIIEEYEYLIDED